MKIVIITKDNRTIELTEQDLNDEVVFIREPNKLKLLFSFNFSENVKQEDVKELIIS